MTDPGVTGSTRVAVYIDFDNIVISRYDQVHGRGQWQQDRARRTAEGDVAARLEAAEVNFGAVIDYASSYGTIALTRAYADWSRPMNARYQRQLVERSVELVQLFPAAAYGKNGADIRLAIDAVEDMFRLQDVTHVLIMAGDSDYVPLAQRLKRLNRYVVGVGVADSTAESLSKSCDRFAFYGDLPGVDDGADDDGAPLKVPPARAGASGSRATSNAVAGNAALGNAALGNAAVGNAEAAEATGTALAALAAETAGAAGATKKSAAKKTAAKTATKKTATTKVTAKKTAAKRTAAAETAAETAAVMAAVMAAEELTSAARSAPTIAQFKAAEPQAVQPAAVSQQKLRQRAAGLLQRALRLGLEKSDDDWQSSGGVKSQMMRLDPAFSEKALGYSSFSDFVKQSGVAELDETDQVRRVRLKAKTRTLG